MAAGRGSFAFVAGLALVLCPRIASGLPYTTLVESGSEGPLASGSLLLTLRGAYRTTSPWGREVLGLLEVTVPLDRFVAQAPSREEARSADQPNDAGPSEDDVQPAPPRQIVLRVTPALARDTVRAALRAAGDHLSRARLASLASRARASAALPELRLRAAHSTDESLRLSPTAADPYRYTQSGGADLAFEARLAWKLDRLVFADEELGVERLRGQRAASRARLVQAVIHTLFSWQRSELRKLDPELSSEDRVEAALKALEALVTLDILTGGWFGMRVARFDDSD